MPRSKENRRGQTQIACWVDTPIARAVKARLSAEGKTYRELITKFLRWYGGTDGYENGNDAENEDSQAPETN